MYIGDNKTALASQRLIADALLTLLKSKSFSDISISELCKEAKVSRQTFYTLFKSKENIIIYELQSKYPFVLNDKDVISLQDMCYYFSLYIKTNSKFLKLIIDNGLSQILFDSLNQGFLSCSRIIPKEYEKNRDFIASFAAGALTSLTKTCIEKEACNNLDFTKELTYSLFSGLFFKSENN
jgi:Bacterial regulatory proteins, tetR family